MDLRNIRQVNVTTNTTSYVYNITYEVVASDVTSINISVFGDDMVAQGDVYVHRSSDFWMGGLGALPYQNIHRTLLMCLTDGSTFFKPSTNYELYVGVDSPIQNDLTGDVGLFNISTNFNLNDVGNGYDIGALGFPNWINSPDAAEIPDIILFKATDIIDTFVDHINNGTIDATMFVEGARNDKYMDSIKALTDNPDMYGRWFMARIRLTPKVVNTADTTTGPFRKIGYPTVFCKTRQSIKYTYRPTYITIGSTSKKYDPRFGDDPALQDDSLSDREVTEGNNIYGGGPFNGVIDYGVVNNGKFMFATPKDRIRFGVNTTLVMPPMTVKTYIADYVEYNTLNACHGALPEYIFITGQSELITIKNAGYEVNTDRVPIEDGVTTIARLYIESSQHEEWVTPSVSNFLQDQGGSNITTDEHHIYYVDQPASPYFGCYYMRSDNNLVEQTKALPWLWRNGEPFYIQNDGRYPLTVSWEGVVNGSNVAGQHYTWANIIFNPSTNKITDIIISDYNISDGSSVGFPGPFVGCPVMKTIIPAGHRCYIFRIDNLQVTLETPKTTGDDSDPGYVSMFISDPNGVCVEHQYWTPGVAYLGDRKHRINNVYVSHSPFTMTGDKMACSIGGNLSSLFLSCKVSGYTYSSNNTGFNNAIAFARDIFTDPSKQSWQNADVKFRASSLFAYLERLIDASRLEFPVATAPFAFATLFSGCIFLEAAPVELPALALAPGAYASMLNYQTGQRGGGFKLPIVYADRIEPLHAGDGLHRIDNGTVVDISSSLFHHSLSLTHVAWYATHEYNKASIIYITDSSTESLNLLYGSQSRGLPTEWCDTGEIGGHNASGTGHVDFYKRPVYKVVDISTGGTSIKDPTQIWRMPSDKTIYNINISDYRN